MLALLYLKSSINTLKAKPALNDKTLCGQLTMNKYANEQWNFYNILNQFSILVHTRVSFLHVIAGSIRVEGIKEIPWTRPDT